MPTETLEPSTSQKKQEEILFSWTAFERPFKRRSRDFYITIISIATLFGLVLFIIEGIMPVLLIMAAFFLFYVLSTVEPSNIEYQVTNLGIRLAGELIEWETMGRFWFAKRLGSEVLVVEVSNFAGRLELVIDQGNKMIIKREVSKYITHEKVAPSMVDKAANWAGKKLPRN